MKTPNVDLVLVIDTSSSMRPCIDQLKQHLRELVRPMQGQVARVRYGVVGCSASSSGRSTIYKVNTLAGNCKETTDALYGSSNQVELLSENPDKVIKCLDGLTPSGNEDSLVALDYALDHPFGPVSDTKRIVALFSDEKLEDGVEGGAPLDAIPKLVEKIHARRVKLFCAIPFSDAAQRLSEANGAEIEPVEGGNGLGGVDFRLLLGQMGKSISVASLQGGLQEKYERALFQQDRWGEGSGWSEDDRA